MGAVYSRSRLAQISGRLEDSRLLRGRGRFTDDLRFAGELQGVVVRSPHPSAGLRRLDTAAAARVDGVMGIVTAHDLAADGVGGLPFMSTVEAPGGGPVQAIATPLLARDVVRYVGEPVAFVVAESRSAAEDAAERVVVDYAPRECVTDVLAAADSGAPLVQEDSSGNVVGELRLGDPAACRAAFAGAKHRVGLRLRNNRVVPHAMEPRTAIGLYDAANATWTLHCGTQAPHYCREILADAVFHVPRERIRVKVGDIGGAFGGKVTPYPEDALVLYAARRFGRPVRWRAERGESFLADYHARDHAAEIEVAFDDALRIVALRTADHANLGAYATPFGIPIATTTGNRIATGCPFRKLDPYQGTVQTAKVSDELDLTTSLGLPGKWRVFAQRQVRAGAVVIVCVGSEYVAQMRFAKDDHMVQAFSSDRSDQALDVSVLPRRAWRCRAVPDAHGFDPPLEHLPVGAIAIADKEFGCRVPRKCL